MIKLLTQTDFIETSNKYIQTVDFSLPTVSKVDEKHGEDMPGHVSMLLDILGCVRIYQDMQGYARMCWEVSGCDRMC